ncbi:hypothetical protein E5288_WYG017901 [Bos mutus]|uniref:Uncharacterized protein n=1 Tax=Bos mutus TaxID=72004 RepID=A0A6B0S5V7_9CETA|nr:hypothetical protein [Bos mutus]
MQHDCQESLANKEYVLRVTPLTRREGEEYLPRVTPLTRREGEEYLPRVTVTPLTRREGEEYLPRVTPLTRREGEEYLPRVTPLMRREGEAVLLNTRQRQKLREHAFQGAVHRVVETRQKLREHVFQSTVQTGLWRRAGAGEEADTVVRKGSSIITSAVRNDPPPAALTSDSTAGSQFRSWNSNPVLMRPTCQRASARRGSWSPEGLLKQNHPSALDQLSSRDEGLEEESYPSAMPGGLHLVPLMPQIELYPNRGPRM